MEKINVGGSRKAQGHARAEKRVNSIGMSGSLTEDQENEIVSSVNEFIESDYEDVREKCFEMLKAIVLQ